MPVFSLTNLLHVSVSRGQSEEERTSTLFSLWCAHMFSVLLLILNSPTSLLYHVLRNSNKCQVQYHLMEYTPIKWMKWKNGSDCLPWIWAALHVFFSVQSDYFYQVPRKFPITQTNSKNPMRSPAHFEEESWDVIQSLEPFVSYVIPNTN